MIFLEYFGGIFGKIPGEYFLCTLKLSKGISGTQAISEISEVTALGFPQVRKPKIYTYTAGLLEKNHARVSV